MKKRYLILIAVLGIGCMFWLLFCAGEACAPTQTQAPLTLEPEAPLAQKDDLIVVETPRPQATVSSPLVVKGKARGNWYFEGSFPVVLTDWDGKILAQGIAKAQGEWMTSEYVPFSASLSYTLPLDTPYRRGFLILKKDNPSGEPQFDNSLEVPINL